MAFTREFLRKTAKESGVEIPKEFENALISEHLSSRDAYAKEQLEENKQDPVDVKKSDEYKKLKQEYDDYKTQVAGEKTYKAKADAYRELLKESKVPENRIAAIMKVSKPSIETMELDDDGKVKEKDKFTKSIKEEWADFIPKEEKKGADVDNPPGSGDNSGGKKTKEEILKITDRAERQKAIRENMELFQ